MERVSKIKFQEIMTKINPNSFIEDYLTVCGVENITDYLNPTMDMIENSENYDNIIEGAELLKKHIENKSLIGILVDSDSDGYSSMAVIYQYLKQVINDIEIVLFTHLEKSHGLTDIKVFNKIKESNIKLLIVPDAGSGDFKQHEELKRTMGLDILVLDHHQCKGKSKNAVVINNQMSDKIQNKCLSGGGVTYKFCEYLDKINGTDYVKDLMDLCAFSIIADIMDIRTIENRVYIQFGLDLLNQGKGNLFLQMLCQRFAKNKIITPTVIAWNISPKINSVIRSDNQELKDDLVNAFISTDEKEIKAVIKQLDSSHKEQKDTTKSIMETVDILCDDNVVIGSTKGTSANYTGLVANMLCSAYEKPVMLIRDKDEDDNYYGSCRSTVPLRGIFDDSGLFEYAAGHEEAYGIKFHKDQYEDIYDLCNNLEVPDPTCTKVFTDTNKIPKSLFKLDESLDMIWGTKLPKPLFCVENIQINGTDIQTMGNGSTIKFWYKGLTYIKFFCGMEFKENIYQGQDVDLNVTVLGTLNLNEYNGKTTEQMIMDKILVEKRSKEIKKKSWQDCL